MPAHCKTCEHPQRVEVERQLRGTRAVSLIAGQFGLDRDALARHRNRHMVVPPRAVRLAAAAMAQPYPPTSVHAWPPIRPARPDPLLRPEELALDAEWMALMDLRREGLADPSDLARLAELDAIVEALPG